MKAIPEGFNTVTPVLVLKDAVKAIETYKKAFGAEEMSMMKDPESGKVVHACLKIGNSMVFVSDEMPGCGGTTQNAGLYIYTEDADAAFEKARKAGLTEKMPVRDMFWGDRLGTLGDADGLNWTIATHKRDVTQAELEKGFQEMKAQMGNKAA